MTCDPKIRIDIDETYPEVTYWLEPYILTDIAACGEVDYEFSTSLQTATTHDTTYDLFSSGEAVFSKTEMTITFSNINSFQLGTLKVHVNIRQDIPATATVDTYKSDVAY